MGVRAIKDDLSGSGIDANRACLLAVADRRDRHAFRLLFQHFAPRIKAIMIASGAAPALAEDLAQDVMLAVWHKAASYSPQRGSVSTWVFAIARNARIDRLRRGSSQPYEDVNELEIAAEGGDGESEAIASSETSAVNEAISSLPEEQRQIIELAFVHDMTQSDIARKMELPLGTVKSRMRLAYRKLRSGLEHLR